MNTVYALKKVIGARGLKLTRQREAIMEEFFRSPGHLSAEELHRRVCRKRPRTGFATVYRTLKLLRECGLAHTGTFGHGERLFEPSRTQGHHDHLICVSCGRIDEFVAPSIESLQEDVARRKGFTLIRHTLELYGVCSACAEKKSAARGRKG